MKTGPGPVAISLAAALLAAGAAGAEPEVREPGSGVSVEVLARAAADEYFYGIGNPSNHFVYEGIDPAACATNGARVKVNQAYVWGLGRSGRGLFFGTMANTDTLVLSGYLRQTNPAQTFYNVSEYGAGVHGQAAGVPAAFGDWRPPRLFRYDLEAGTCADLAPLLPATDRERLMAVLGIRAGGGVPPSARNPAGAAVLAGPMLAGRRGCAFFFFDSAGAFLGSVEKPRYTNIRRFVEVNGDLYAPVQLTNGAGAVIRWINDPAAPGFPLKMVEVGALDQGGGDIAVHEGRIFVTTWPGLLERAQVPGSGVTAQDLFLHPVGLWMSPVVPAAGLPKGSAWTKVWNVNDYEPDPIIAAAYGGGALASFDGWLYFGTLHIPLLSTLVHAVASGDYARAATSTPEQVEAWLRDVFPKTHRAASFFRGRNFRAPRVLGGITLEPGGEFQLLYGYTNLWVFDADTRAFSLEPNGMGQVPRMGGPGFDNVSNCYTWAMEVLDHDLYVGTFDLSFPSSSNRAAEEAANPQSGAGGDLLRLPSSRAKAFEAVSRNGLGNIAAYGFRTMAVAGSTLYIGTANPRNLLTDPDDGLPPGGWELLAFTKRRGTAWDQDGDYAADFAVFRPDGGVTTFLSRHTNRVERSAVKSALPAFADFDGDGLTDPGFFNPAAGAWTCWLSARDFARQKPVTLPEGLGALPVPADYDGDGNADFGLWLAGDSSFRWLSSRTARWNRAVPPLAPAFPAPGRYGTGGREEAAWYVPASGRWCRQMKAGGPVSVLTLSPRVRNGVPVPADFTGDGRTDFAVHEPATGLLHIWDSATRTHETRGPMPSPWLPACADYDADGKADAAWYQPGTRRWSVTFSGTGETVETDLSAGLETGCRPVMAPPRLLYKALQ